MDNLPQANYLPLVTVVKISHSLFGEILTTTEKVSREGVIVKTPNLKLPPLTSLIDIQVINLEEEMPVRKMKLSKVIEKQGMKSIHCFFI